MSPTQAHMDQNSGHPSSRDSLHLEYILVIMRTVARPHSVQAIFSIRKPLVLGYSLTADVSEGCVAMAGPTLFVGMKRPLCL